MASSPHRTWLPLDEFAQIIGISPLGFNQLSKPAILPSTIACGEVFFQNTWQHADRVGRDDIAMAIQEAEQEISKEVGFNLMPDWELDERRPYPRNYRPESYGDALNIRGMNKSVETAKGHVISGGIRAKTLIQAGANITRSDVDADTFQETATVVVATAITDTNEIHLFYPAQNGDDAWEIRPIKVAISGGNATITFKIWQVAAANQMNSLAGKVLDPDQASSFETTVDVYRVYNDPSTQLSMLWEGESCCADSSCTACQFGAQSGCFHTRDPRIGFIVPVPATWDSANNQFTDAYWSACREPDMVRLWYYSGYIDRHLPRPYAELATFWKYAVAYFAASKFDRPVCGCSNVAQFVAKWRLDAAFSSMQDGGFSTTAEQSGNRLGTTMGALYAYRQTQRPGVKVNK